ncbi:hypothetical protein [Maribellus maritimus]|uniref:hypothetical protein n=1 Tax=Maribellus maritimus TaxID=2870838 RepID=UPI001EECD84C|nr:hypothetical protein [Maribellus maritimus]MCG6189000.1 hypothetical protein [Maribellus maritimus]
MKDLFLMGGPFMSALTILLVITTAWIFYHFIVAYNSKSTDKTVFLRKLGYGRMMGLFSLTTGVLGQMIGFSGMFSIIQANTEQGLEIRPEIVFEGIRATMICTIYGILIYLLSLLLWFIASILIEKKQTKQVSV